MGQPITQFAKAGDVHIAYQVIGDGPVDLVWSYGLASNIEVFWEEPSLAAFFRRLAEFSRLIIFDRRGCGLSDRGGSLTTPTLEERADDILAVLDAVGSEKASIFGVSEGGGIAALFASAHPERTTSIIVYGTLVLVKGLEHPLGWHDEAVAIAWAESVAAGWGTGKNMPGVVSLWAASMVGDEQFEEWLGRYGRQSVSRNEIRPLLMNTFRYDLTEVFPAVRVPALALYRKNDPIAPATYGREIAARIPDAEFVEVDGIDHLPFVGDSESLASEIERFLVGPRSHGARQRRLLTLVVMEVAESARTLADEDAWRELLAAHHRDVAAHVSRFGGDEVKHVGDNVLATFDGPARAIQCALGVLDAAERRGLPLRVAVHTGECDIADGEVRGVATHIVGRLADLAEPGEVLASSTVSDLVAGSGIRFAESREVDLGGVAGVRTVVPVLRRGVTPEGARRLAVDQANVFRRDGEYWTVGYRGLLATLRDSKGLRDISRLLAEPGREFHVLDLAAERVPPPPRVADSSRVDDGTGRGGAHEPVIDDRARAEYQRRIRELESDIDDASQAGDDHRAASAREELDALVDALTAAYGLGGRPRRTTDDAERARKAVTRRVRDAMTRIERAHPPLGRHFAASIRTGLFCRYEPERDHEWLFERSLLD